MREDVGCAQRARATQQLCSITSQCRYVGPRYSREDNVEEATVERADYCLKMAVKVAIWQVNGRRTSHSKTACAREDKDSLAAGEQIIKQRERKTETEGGTELEIEGNLMIYGEMAKVGRFQ
ncbi:hypothetical protein E2C01_017965 [Portunus trituberculatus]|uniref:Uncharacterized protein n=1 Tax=Portunus trituberculatus TaxID=210409 RepID=A0A5B7DTA5_PORTR|nr:hypothetical protein [Portunus trituberculatus]